MDDVDDTQAGISQSEVGVLGAVWSSWMALMAPRLRCHKRDERAMVMFNLK